MILDIIVIAILLVSLIVGYKVGLAKTLLSLVGAIVALLVAVFLGEYLSNVIYDSFISEAVIESVTESVTSQAGNTAITIDSLPSFVQFALSFVGYEINPQSLSAVGSVPTAIATSLEMAIKPVVTAVMSFALTLVLFILVYLVYRLLVMRLLLKVFKLPLIRSLNAILGAVCSLLTAILFVSFIAFLLRIVTPYVNDIPYFLSESTIYNSYIFYHFYSGNIFYALISIF